MYASLTPQEPEKTPDWTRELPASAIWVLDDGRMGNTTQSLGIAQALNPQFIRLPIEFTLRGRLPNRLQPASLGGVTEATREHLQAPWPKLAIGAGRRLAPVLRAIKKLSHGETRIIQLLDPECEYRAFDLIVLPEHDRPTERPNLLTSMCTPHRLTVESLKQAADSEWVAHWSILPRPHVALILGGDTRHGPFSVAAAQQLVAQLNQQVTAMGGSVMVSSSRRTPYRALQQLRNGLVMPYSVYDWHQMEGENNPLLAMLATADYLVLTGDSMAMISEAAFTGKPLFIADEGPHIAPKHRRFHQELYKAGIARPLAQGLQPYRYEIPHPAQRIATHIRQRFLLG